MTDNKFDILISSGQNTVSYWKDVWKFRELFYFLSWRDILIRYKQTVIGLAWSIIRPLITMVVFTVIFGKVANLPDEGIPYLLLVSAGILPWQFFATAFADSGNSLVNNGNMISKVYFPRIIIPLSTIIVALVDFLIALCLLAFCMIYYRFAPGIEITLLPVFIIHTILVSAGAGLLTAALNVKYRDFRFIIPFVIQFGLFLSPVGFSSTIIPEKYRYIYYLNPMAGAIDGFRYSLLNGRGNFDVTYYSVSLVTGIILLLAGYRYFRKIEHNFADLI